MSQAFSVKLPLPPARLHPNERPHHMERARLTKKARGNAKILALAALHGGARPYFIRSTITACWGFKEQRHRDEANLQQWLKAYVDGLVDAGIMVDDSTDHLGWAPCEIAITSVPFVILIITPTILIECTPSQPPKSRTSNYETPTSEPPAPTEPKLPPLKASGGPPKRERRGQGSKTGGSGSKAPRPGKPAIA